MNKDWRQTFVSKLILGVMLCSGNCLIASGQVSNSIVIPNEYKDKVGETVGATLEGLHQFTYLTSQFQFIGDQEISINSVSLRPRLNGSGSSLDVVVPKISISMGTFTKPLSQLSPIAADNHGADFTQVYSHESVALTFVPVRDPDNFLLVFNLDSPFNYNPRNGHFMFEWRASDFQDRPYARIDFANYPGPEAPAYEAAEFGDDLGYGGFVLSLGYTIVPEPSSLIVMVVLGGLGVVAQAQNRA